MSKTQKEIPDKKHKIRRAFLGIAIGIGLVVAGAAGYVAISGATLYSVVEIAAMALGVGALVGGGVGMVAFATARSIAKNKKIATQSLNKIREYDRDKSSKVSERERAKVCRKYANANLRLCKLTNGTIYGLFKSLSGASEQETKILNEIEQYSILEQAAKNSRQQKKYAHKKEVLQGRLTTRETKGRPWTQVYNDVADGVQVFDRRTEICCKNEDTKMEFIEKFGSPKGKSSKVGCIITMNFDEESSSNASYIATEEIEKTNLAKQLLIKDILEYFEDKTDIEVRSHFPITLETKKIDKDSTKVLKQELKTYYNLTELKSELSEEISR